METLVEAQRGHLEVGQMIYVRGRKAVVIDVDYPIIFWRFQGEQVVKHRSHHATLFQVPAGTPIRQIRKNTTSSMVDFTDSDNEEEEVHGSRRQASNSTSSEEDFAVVESFGVDPAALEVEFPAFEDQEIPEAFAPVSSPKDKPRANDDEDSEEEEEEEHD
jgi:hypothetical protein